ncbi:MAG: hypothetical protein KTR31_20005 [Myxococcales bacterium]|nr:hypothetical protein [Myxococcales bacterium]
MSEAVFAAGLCATRVQEPSEALVALVRDAVVAARDAALRLPPLGLLADVALIMSDARCGLTGVKLPGLDLRRYDDRVVGPLVVDRRRTALSDALASQPASMRGLAVALVTERLLEELEPDGPWWEPGALRSWLTKSPTEAWAMATQSLGQPEAHSALQARLSHMAKRGPVSFGRSDVHLVEHLSTLATRAQRVAVRQVLEASESVGEGLPRTVRPRRRSGLATSHLKEEDRYPAGGFSALTTAGSPENLVASELVYMEDGDEIDLFDVRFAEGELLYYTRDESAHLRQRRNVHVALAADLVHSRVKDPDVPWQRLVIVLGILQATVQRLVEWLARAELVVWMHPIGAGLSEEADLLELVLKTWVDIGVVKIHPLPSAEALPEAMEATLGVGETDVVWMSAGQEPPELPIEAFQHVVEATPLSGWTQVADALVRHVA